MNSTENNKPLTIAIIPARGGSKGIPGKNLKMIKGSPLIAYTIRAARRSPLIDKVIVTSDDDEILSVSRAVGSETIKRPDELATDESPTEPSLEHAVKTLEDQGDIISSVILLQCTSPLRDENDIESAILLFKEMNADSLLSVCESHSFFWKKDFESQNASALYDYKNRPRRQDIRDKDRIYRENGAIYITKRDILMNQHNRLGGNIALYIMSEYLSIEIDTEFDFWLCESIMKNREKFNFK